MKTALENPKIADEAANWAISIDSGDFTAADREALAVWLKKSPLHIDEFLLATSIFLGLDDVKSWGSLSIDELLANVAPDVIPLNQHGDGLALNDNQDAEGDRHHPRKSVVYAIVSMAACLLVAVTFWFGNPADIATINGADEAGVYATALGEQRSIALPDGSVVHVNTLSEIKVEFTEQRRVVHLLRGEVMFEVEHDPSRPFQVMANGTIAEAIGTKFNVRVTQDGARVVVVEGKVAVDTEKARAVSPTSLAKSSGAVAEPSRLPDGRMLITTGQEANLGALKLPVFVPQVNVAAATLWRSRRLSFEGDELRSIVGEFSRYNRLKITLADAELARTKFSGVFSADDPESLIDFLKLTGDVSVQKSGPNEITLKSIRRR